MDISEYLFSFEPYASLAGDVIISDSAWIHHVGMIVSGETDAFVGYQTLPQVTVYILYPTEFMRDLASMTERRSPVTVVCRKPRVSIGRGTRMASG